MVIDETTQDSDSVVGDECHIISGAANGPRHDPSIDQQLVDDLPNLLLLCRVHHKMADDQFETYTVELLRTIKANHEQWVESKFKEDKDQLQPVCVKRFKSEIPTQLKHVESGQELYNLASISYGMYQNHSDNLTDDEVEVVGGFLQSIKDWMDIAGDLEPIDVVRAKSSINTELKELQEHGFLVFAAREKQRLEGGIGAPSNFYILHVSIIRETDKSIVRT